MTDPEQSCGVDCTRRIFYNVAYSSATVGIKYGLTAYDAVDWCVNDNADWCPETINTTVSALASRVVKAVDVDFSNCCANCVLTNMDIISQKATLWAMEYTSILFDNVTVSNTTNVNTMQKSRNVLAHQPAPVIDERRLNEAMSSTTQSSTTTSGGGGGGGGGGGSSNSDDDDDDTSLLPWLAAPAVLIGPIIGAGVCVYDPVLCAAAKTKFITKLSTSAIKILPKISPLRNLFEFEAVSEASSATSQSSSIQSFMRFAARTADWIEHFGEPPVFMPDDVNPMLNFRRNSGFRPWHDRMERWLRGEVDVNSRESRFPLFNNDPRRRAWPRPRSPSSEPSNPDLDRPPAPWDSNSQRDSFPVDEAADGLRALYRDEQWNMQTQRLEQQTLRPTQPDAEITEYINSFGPDGPPDSRFPFDIMDSEGRVIERTWRDPNFLADFDASSRWLPEGENRFLFTTNEDIPQLNSLGEPLIASNQGIFWHVRPGDEPGTFWLERPEGGAPANPRTDFAMEPGSADWVLQQPLDSQANHDVQHPTPAIETPHATAHATPHGSPPTPSPSSEGSHQDADDHKDNGDRNDDNEHDKPGNDDDDDEHSTTNTASEKETKQPPTTLQTTTRPPKSHAAASPLKDTQVEATHETTSDPRPSTRSHASKTKFLTTTSPASTVTKTTTEKPSTTQLSMETPYDSVWDNPAASTNGALPPQQGDLNYHNPSNECFGSGHYLKNLPKQKQKQCEEDIMKMDPDATRDWVKEIMIEPCIIRDNGKTSSGSEAHALRNGQCHLTIQGFTKLEKMKWVIGMMPDACRIHGKDEKDIKLSSTQTCRDVRNNLAWMAGHNT